jgi:hypothetical protein
VAVSMRDYSILDSCRTIKLHIVCQEKEVPHNSWGISKTL